MAKVLLVDDDPLVRRSLAIALESAGHAVTEAANGADGIREAEAQPVDVIVTDIFMPGGEGMEFITQMRTSGSDTPIIAITGGYTGAMISVGNDTSLYLKAAGLLGATRTLSKPFKPAALCAAVDECLTDAVKS